MIDLEVTDGVAFITINAPATRNALNNELADQLVTACDAADRDPAVGAAVIKGAGGTFCSGAERGHLDEVGRDPAEEGRYASLSGIYRAFTRVGQLEVPTIAAVRGAAVGAGINLMLATDLRIVAEDARLISGFLRIGLHPGGGHFALLAGRAGAETAAAAGLFGEELSGLRAVELGLAWQALPSGQVEERAAELARRAASDPELARKATASLRTELGPPRLPWAAALEVERGAQLWSLRRRASKGQEQ
jgi:enoyl-CoA hydratase